MSLIPGKYKLENNENFVAFLKSLGVPEDNATFADKLRPTVEVKVEGDKVEIISDSGVKNTHQIYILGKECDDPLPTEHIAKSVAKIEGNKILVHTKCAELNIDGNRTYDFTNDGFVLTYHNKSGDSKRIFKRI
ncbi:hypothetical protein QE152_g24800 [Popillia japonica]|uniref:Uncharacterized protein n=1 Tax=Popillia japonica TaxID=7064 RepID=A0AAW1K3W4_POPJA